VLYVSILIRKMAYTHCTVWICCVITCNFVANKVCSIKLDAMTFLTECIVIHNSTLVVLFT